MKEFCLKHPLITLMIVNEICVTIKTIVTHEYESSDLSDIPDVIVKSAKAGWEKGKELASPKVEIGFHSGS